MFTSSNDICCNFVKIEIAIKSTKKIKFDSFIVYALYCIFTFSLSLLHLYMLAFISSLIKLLTTEFYCDCYKIKANTNTSSNAKRQRYKHPMSKLLELLRLAFILHEYISRLDCKFDWLLASDKRTTHITTFMEYIKTCKINIASWLNLLFLYVHFLL